MSHASVLPEPAPASVDMDRQYVHEDLEDVMAAIHSVQCWRPTQRLMLTHGWPLSKLIVIRQMRRKSQYAERLRKLRQRDTS